MKNVINLLIGMMLMSFLQISTCQADQLVKMAAPVAVKDIRLVSNYSFQRADAQLIKPKSTQATTDKAEDGPPTGPNNELSATYLADQFESASPRHIRNDFGTHIPFSDEIFRDHTSLNTFYFYPSGYLLNYDATDGFDINFLHRTRTDTSQEELVVLSFTLQPRQLNGGLSLLQELASYAIKPANEKALNLQRLPISSVKVNLSGLSSLIPEENVAIINSPQKVGDPIRVKATMTQAQKEDVVASIRSGGLAGDIVFTTNNGSFQLVIPYFVSFTDFSGQWITDVTQLSNTNSIKNLSPYPLLLSGLVVYAKAGSSPKLKRHEIPLSQPVVMDSGAMASADKAFSDLVASYGEVISAWPKFERVSCDECIAGIERAILVSPAQASRVDLPIEAIPNIFDQFSLFKVLVEVRSKLFSPNNDAIEVKSFTLRPDELRLNSTLYVNRDADDTETNFEYRVMPFHQEGLEMSVSDWKSNQGVMDITITAGDIRPLAPQD